MSLMLSSSGSNPAFSPVLLTTREIRWQWSLLQGKGVRVRSLQLLRRSQRRRSTKWSGS